MDARRALTLLHDGMGCGISTFELDVHFWIFILFLKTSLEVYTSNL